MPDWYRSKSEVETRREQGQQRQRLNELRKKLSATDHKVYADYEPKPGEDVDAIKAARSAWRAEARELIKQGADEPVEEE